MLYAEHCDIHESPEFCSDECFETSAISDGFYMLSADTTDPADIRFAILSEVY
jgi:hypothetical protein